MFLIFKHGVGLITGGLTADWKFSNAGKDKQISVIALSLSLKELYHEIYQNSNGGAATKLSETLK